MLDSLVFCSQRRHGAYRTSTKRRAVEARVRRVLAKEGRVLRRCRPTSRWYRDLGDYYTHDAATNHLNGTHLDLEDLARDLEMLGQTQTIED